MSRSFQQLLSLLQSANAQAQMLTTMIGEVEQSEACVRAATQPSEVEACQPAPPVPADDPRLLELIADRDALAECLQEWKELARRSPTANPPAWLLTRGEKDSWNLALSPDEGQRLESIAEHLKDGMGHFTASEIVARGLTSLEAEIRGNQAILDTFEIETAPRPEAGGSPPPEGWRTSMLEEVEAENI